MPFYVQMGNVPHKRHTQMRKPDGSLYSEEVIGAAGFSGIQSIAYHLHPPTVIERLEDPIPYSVDYVNLDYLRHRHVKGFEVAPGGDWLTGRTYIMGNDDVRLALCVPTDPMSYFFRNAVADEMVFVHEGEGVLQSPFGNVEFSPGDYVHVPRTITHRWEFTGDQQPRLLIIESFSEIHPPKRYRNEFGQLLENSPYCERDFRPPSELITHDEEGEFEVRIAKHNYLHRLFFRYHPFDFVGWDGYMYPYATSINDFEPITGRVHLPPPTHQHFEGRNFVICSFVPRLYDYHPDAIPTPYNHSNIDSDEVLYYVKGDFMSRKGISSGSFTLHPGGIAHGPHPGMVEASIGKKGTDEMAVMVDTFRPLRLTKASLEIEDEDYMLSWRPEMHSEDLPSNGR
ncbi:MAG: homogentisate 1,2-dioxygenase [Bacteroidetes bacterium]|nr:homogentisate 1,2-dioxygenase [Bacteroidota bacterium]